MSVWAPKNAPKPALYILVSWSFTHGGVTYESIGQPMAPCGPIKAINTIRKNERGDCIVVESIEFL